ncbi:hypothetical protein HOG21_03890 [bacterium]|jgi:phosphoribosylglycinamide formyltransferase 1|nr:hypothetical protein [bacterium]
MKIKPKVVFFGTGSQNGGGSGIREMLRNVQSGILDVEVVGIVTNFVNGGVDKIAKEYGIETFITNESFDIKNDTNSKTIEFYQEVFNKVNPDFVMLSGWVYKIPAKSCGNWMLNIHPGPAIEGIDKGKFGSNVHKRVIEAYKSAKLNFTAVTMHVVSEVYDEGEVIFKYPISIEKNDTYEDIAARVNKIEHGWQSFILSEYIKSFGKFRMVCNNPY